jgi:thiosulfate/3-mercaptopyruvate sulfurtransferase
MNQRAAENAKPAIGSLVDVDTFSGMLQSDTVKVVDLRKPSMFQEGHIPGAINIWRSDIENSELPYSGMIASKEKMEQLLSGLGITSSDFLVIYDDNASCDAARLWWVLDHYGFDRMALLNGGLNAWKQSHAITSDSTNYPTSSFAFPPALPSKRIILKDELISAITDSTVVLIDTRTTEEYDGDYIKDGAFERGRIPGSIHIDWVNAMNYQEQTFKTKEELKLLFSSYGMDSSSQVVTYCHSGVRSAHTLFVLTQLLGYQNVRNYDGSWVEWSFHQLPFERKN